MCPNCLQMIKILGRANSEPWVVAESEHWLSLIHTTRPSSLALLQLGHLIPPAVGGGSVSSPALMPHRLAHLHPMPPEPPELAPLCCPVKARGPISKVLQPVKNWVSSPTRKHTPLSASSPVPSPLGPGPLCYPGGVQGVPSPERSHW
jgi:hypothetical protein